MKALAGRTDTELVTDSLTGNRDAFGQIVARYQSLICSLAYSATGSLSHSEDLAQETFVTAWKRLHDLRDSAKLRPWLCGITRNLVNNWLRRQGREPSHAAETLDAIVESRAPEPLPPDQAISTEEAAILWRSLEHIPQLYREPLVLFYREHQSVEKVAAALELSEDAVKQRLARGRKLLHEQVLAFVEGALERTAPGNAFTLGVLAALPAFAMSASVASVGAAAVKGSALAKAAATAGLAGAILGYAGAILGSLLPILGSWLGVKAFVENNESPRERQFRIKIARMLFVPSYFFISLMLVLVLGAKTWWRTHQTLIIVTLVVLSVSLIVASVVLFWRTNRILLQIRSEEAAKRPPGVSKKHRVEFHPFEYRSRLTLLGLPLVHVQLGGGRREGKMSPVKAWIAVGDVAFGILCAFGGVAIGPVSAGGLAVGLISVGGCAVGILAVGGGAMGWLAIGGGAVAWQAADGALAIARVFAVGVGAFAQHANDEVAQAFVQNHVFFTYGEALLKCLSWFGLLLMILPLLQVLRARKAERGQRVLFGALLIPFALFGAGCKRAAAAGDAVVSTTLTNGIRVVSVHFPASTNVSIFSFLPMGLTSDEPGQAQWSHLVEHLVIRSTMPADLPRANAETLPDHMRLDFYGNASNWQEGLSHHRRWLEGVPFTEASLAAEKPKVIAELGY